MAATVKAVIFDIDGTLLDSVDLHAKAWVEAFAHFGVEAETAVVRRQIGKGGDQLLPVFLDEERIARDGETIEAYRSDLFKRVYLGEVRPFPGVRGLLARIRAEGQTIAVASSGKASEVARYLEILGVTDLVDVVVSADDAARSKPHPDIFEAALRALAPIGGDEAVVVGDTRYDVEAAGKAGLATVVSYAAAFPESELRAAGCVAIYRDPGDLLDSYPRSALYRAARDGP